MRHFQSVLSQELQRAGRFDRPLAVLMIDVDHLREINTTRGHLAGDRALKSVASALQSETREYDVAAHFGGDEFCVVLPETDLEGVLVVAEHSKLRRELVLRSKGDRVPGRCHTQGRGTTTEALVALADRAAYRAKFSGRNSVALPPEGDPVDEAERFLYDVSR